MSYYFAIVGTKDNPLFELEFGTSKQGGDGIARFREEARHMNQFIVHSSLDIVEEVQWAGGQMYLKHIDRFHNNYISAFITPSNTKFLLLYNPDTSLSYTPLPASSSAAAGSTPALSRTSSLASAARSSPYSGAAAPFNPTAPAIEDAMRAFFADVFDAWVKTAMNPFYRLNMPIRSPVFRARVAAAAKRYL